MLLLDILLILMISVCIVYCWILNRRIEDLQNSRIEFARMVKELNVSIIKASNSVQELDELSKNTNDQLRDSIADAKDTLQDMLVSRELSGNLINKLNEHNASLKFDLKTISQRDTEISARNVRSSVASSVPLNTKFDDQDLIDSQNNLEVGENSEEIVNLTNQVGYSANIKKFITEEMLNEDAENKINLDQSSYYESLRKVTKG